VAESTSSAKSRTGACSYQVLLSRSGTTSKWWSRLTTGSRCSSARAAIQASLAGIGRPDCVRATRSVAYAIAVVSVIGRCLSGAVRRLATLRRSLDIGTPRWVTELPQHDNGNGGSRLPAQKFTNNQHRHPRTRTVRWCQESCAILRFDHFECFVNPRLDTRSFLAQPTQLSKSLHPWGLVETADACIGRKPLPQRVGDKILERLATFSGELSQVQLDRGQAARVWQVQGVHTPTAGRARPGPRALSHFRLRCGCLPTPPN
jgi:hypothetical protein